MRAFIVAALMAATIAAHAAETDHFTSGNWRGAAVHSDAGVFTHCYAQARYNSGIFMTFGLEPTGFFNLVFSSDDWNLQVGQRYPVELSIDGAAPIRFDAKAIGKLAALIPIGANPSLFQALRRGRNLQVQAAGSNLGFNLDGTSRSLAELWNCAAKQTGLIARTANPFASKPNQPASAPSPSPAAYQAEAIALLSNLLGATGFSDVTILDPDQVPEGLKNRHAVWKATNAWGWLFVAPEAKLDEANAAMVAADTAFCKAGKFASAISPSESNGVRILQTMTACEREKLWTVYYTVMPRTKGGIYVIAIFPAEGTVTEHHREAHDGIREAAFRFLKK